MTVVHGDQFVEIVEILQPNSTCPQIAHPVSTARGGGHGACIWGFADVKTVQPDGVHSEHVAEVFRFDQVAENCFGAGRATNISRADKKNFEHSGDSQTIEQTSSMLKGVSLYGR